jgi:DNA-binding MarR family transcriptional regulator
LEVKMKYGTIIELIHTWEQYEASAKTTGLQDFARWILRNDTASEASGTERPVGASREHAYQNVAPDVMINVLIYRLQKSWEIKTKSVFAASFDLKNLSELRIMACVASKNLPKKNEVIGELLFEITTGTTLIQRLVERGFLTESPDAHDRRVVRLGATERGLSALQSISAPMGEFMRRFYAPLDEAEKAQLIKWLGRLDAPY